MRMFAALLALAGCGRFGFGSTEGTVDAPADGAIDVALDARICAAPSGHDEDRDTVDDACDGCPHLADVDQRDGDRDGVGDVCDVSAAMQQYTLFDPFLTTRPEWILATSVGVANDTMHLPGVGDSIGAALVLPPARDVFSTAGVIGASGSGSRQFSLQVGETTGAGHYYCELYDDGVALSLNFSFTLDDINYDNVAFAPVAGRLANGPVRMTLEHAPPMMTCRATWQGIAYEASGVIPAGIPAEELHIAANDVDVTLDYFVRISTP